jgi:hypothetical protein
LLGLVNMKKALLTAVLIALGLGVAMLFQLTHTPDGSSAPATTSNELGDSPARRATSSGISPRIPSAPATSGVGTPARRAAALVGFVESKYRYLFADLKVSAEAQEELKRLLLTREYATSADRLARDVDLVQQAATLVAIDTRVRTLLDGAAYATYEALKESDAEQSHLVLYEVTIANTAPLSPEQERAILEAKLRHKQRYDAIVKDAGLDWENPSTAERAYTRTTVTRALDEYKENYLREARQILHDEGQYGALNSFETIEFKQELLRRQVAINTR